MNWKYSRDAIKICLVQHFEADFLWKSQPQNPEFRDNPDNFHPWRELDLPSLAAIFVICWYIYNAFTSSNTRHTSGRVAQSVKCLKTDVSLTAEPGVASLIPALSHTFIKIDHGIISTVILLPSAESFKKGCCQLQAKVSAWSTG